MHVTFLGTGTSHGIPVIGCRCEVCTSTDARNRRTRSSVWLHDRSRSLLIDTAPEFRLQAVSAGLSRLDAVLYTHTHADHLHGLDDVRPLSVRRPVPVYGTGPTVRELVRRFPYVFQLTQEGGGKPRLTLHEIDRHPFRASGFTVVPVPLLHGLLPVLGFRIGGFAYLTDCSRIPDESRALLAGLEVLVIDALRYRPHPTHFSVSQALEEIDRLRPTRAYLTHIAHDLEHLTLLGTLPSGIEPAYDGLTFEVDGGPEPAHLEYTEHLDG